MLNYETPISGCLHDFMFRNHKMSNISLAKQEEGGLRINAL